MSAIAPPKSRVWWKQPLDRVEGTWIAIAFVWCLVHVLHDAVLARLR